MRTKERLARALQTAQAPDWMVRKAWEGFYDDFESPIATPIMQLVQDLRAAGLDVLAERAIKGEFDATKEEGDEWMRMTGRNLLHEIKEDVIERTRKSDPKTEGPEK